MLDHLIAKGLEPDYKAEYILMRDIELNQMFDGEDGMLYEGTIVCCVIATVSKDNIHTGYDFIVKDTNKMYHTNYPWILALNTPENIIKIKKAKEFEKLRDIAIKTYNKVLDEVTTLKIK